MRSPSNYVTSIHIPGNVSSVTIFCDEMFYGIIENTTAISDTVDDDGNPDPESAITFNE